MKTQTSVEPNSNTFKKLLKLLCLTQKQIDVDSFTINIYKYLPTSLTAEFKPEYYEQILAAFDKDEILEIEKTESQLSIRLQHFAFLLYDVPCDFEPKTTTCRENI